MTTRNTQRRAFTLVELMVSVALALLLLVGVNQVFKTTTATVGTGYATSQVMRSHMAAEKVFARDFEKAVPAGQMPSILIHSEQIYAYRDRNDLASDRDGNIATIDLNDNATEGEASVPGEAIRPANYGNRSHRIDTFSFFARDIDNPYRRQTGDQTTSPTTAPLIANEESSEAWIWYGHLRLPKTITPTVANPTGSPNPQGASAGGDFYTPAEGAPAANTNNYFVNDWALGREAILLKGSPAGDYLQPGGGLAPLDLNSTASKSDPVSGVQWKAPYARFDIAATTISNFQKTVAALEAPAPLANWHQTLDYRFNCKPWIVKSSNLTSMSQEMALATPFLARGCNQFIVEYAGDFLQQDNDPASATYGNILSNTPDGVIDYMVYNDGSGKMRPQTRWYGFPRDTGGALKGLPDGQIDSNFDVVPLRDVRPGGAASFEKNVDATLPKVPNYLANGAVAAGAQYICAWGPTELAPASGSSLGPRMIRLVLQVTDSNNRLNEGQVVEYVYSIPQN